MNKYRVSVWLHGIVYKEIENIKTYDCATKLDLQEYAEYLNKVGLKICPTRVIMPSSILEIEKIPKRTA